jgi:hypothetical protein
MSTHASQVCGDGPSSLPEGAQEPSFPCSPILNGRIPVCRVAADHRVGRAAPAAAVLVASSGLKLGRPHAWRLFSGSEGAWALWHAPRIEDDSHPEITGSPDPRNAWLKMATHALLPHDQSTGVAAAVAVSSGAGMAPTYARPSHQWHRRLVSPAPVARRHPSSESQSGPARLGVGLGHRGGGGGRG